MSFFNNPNPSQSGANIFGSTNPNAPAPQNTTPNLFAGSNLFASASTSNAAGAPASNNLFGSNNASATPNSTASGGLFGGANTNAPASGGGGLFGSGSAAAPASAGALFPASNANTTAPANNQGLLGSTNKQAATPNLFGSSAATTSGGFFAATANAPNTNTTSATTNPPANTGSLFGGSPLTIPKPAEQTAPKPAASSFFAQPSQPSSASAPAPTNKGNGLFNLPPKPAAAPTTTPGSSNVPANSLFSGSLFAKPATTSAAPGSANASSTTPAPGSTNKDEEKKDSKDNTSAAPAFNLFGGSKSTEKKDLTTPVTTANSKEAEKPKDASSVAPVIAIPPPSMLRGKTVEEIVNRWSSDLEYNVREFNKFAAEVSVWDRALIENGNNIAAIHGHVLAAERQQNDLNETLDHIEQQQKDLASTLDAYEKVAVEIFGGQGSSLKSLDSGPADTERDKNYMLATDLHTHLDDLSGSLKQMIESVNELSVASKPSETNDEPMSQIAQILSSHLESLQWIDGAVRDVESKTLEVEKRVKESGHNLPGNTGRSKGFGLNR